VKINRVLGLCVAAVLALSACGGDEEPVANASSKGDNANKTVRVWLVGTDTPQPVRDYAIAEFKKATGAKLVIEEQVWDGLVDKLTTALSGNDSPDVVEVGNTQAVAFTSVGAFEDITDKKAELGGDDLLTGFVEGGSYDGKFYAAPYYAGSRLVFYRKDLLKTAGLEVPKTLEEYVAAGEKLKADNGKKDFSGIYWPGQDWRNGLPFIWAAGGDLAVQNGDKWEGALATPESVKGLELIQRTMQNASGAAKDGNETDPQVPYCANKIGMLSAPGWVAGSILAAEGGCPDAKDNLGVFALPGTTAGETAPIFLGGSNIAIAAKSKNKDLAYEALKVLLSDGYQTMMAEAGLIPAKTSLVSAMGETDVAKATAAAAKNTKLTPAAPGWANVEADRIMEDLFVAIAQGGDVATLAAAADQKITAALNR
jgi:N,N'-diacetylchitobiose transport system substrate-binding protein